MSKAYCSGGNWSKRVLFHYRDNDEDECMSYITTKSICEKLSEIAQEEDVIQYVWMYYSPIWQWQKTYLFCYHSFVVFKTKHQNWYSIQKNEKGLVIQKSSKYQNVVLKIQNRKRLKPKGWKTIPDSQIPLKNFISFLIDEKFLEESYNILTKNCKHFSDKIFSVLKEKNSILQKIYREESLSEKYFQDQRLLC